MGLAWINPLYLAGLLLLALPVLIHLAQKQQDSATRFPSLMFLERIPRKQKRRFEIRDWLLLLLRCLLLLLLALAFARPFISGGDRRSRIGSQRQRDPARPLLQHADRRPLATGATAALAMSSTHAARAIASA